MPNRNQPRLFDVPPPPSRRRLYRPVIVAEDREAGTATFGYEVGRDMQRMPFDLRRLQRDFGNAFVAMYARTSEGEIWKFGKDGNLSIANRERYQVSNRDGFTFGGAFITMRGTVESIVIETSTSAPIASARADTAGRYNDIVTRHRISTGDRHACALAEGPTIVALGRGTDARQRYGVELAQLDRPSALRPTGIGTHEEFPYAFVEKRITDRTGKQYLQWELVKPSARGMLPLRVGQVLDPLSGKTEITRIFGVIDPERGFGPTPMSVRPIEDPFTKTEHKRFRELTSKLHQEQMLDRLHSR